MNDSYDVVIAGGGVIGSAVAYFLARDPGFGGSVLVVEKDPTYSGASTALSAGSIRQQFSTPLNIAISAFGAAFVKNAGDWLGIDGEAPALSFVERGYLFLASEDGLPVLRANHAVQRRHGADVALLTPTELTARFPWMRPDGLAGASLGLSNEGWLDPYALLQGFRKAARHLGAVYAQDAVAGLNLAGARVTAVRLASGGEVRCGVFVDAAGIRADDIARMAGLSIPVEPRKRMVYVFDCREEVPGCPLIINPNGVYVRPEGAHFICGVSPPAVRDPACDDLEVDYSFFEETVWPTLAMRIPPFEAIRLVNAWAGHYAYNTFDQNAILGPHPDLPNFLFANGFSGHGLQQSPAVGRGLAEWIVHGEYRSLDLGPLGYGRIPAGTPVKELNIV